MSNEGSKRPSDVLAEIRAEVLHSGTECAVRGFIDTLTPADRDAVTAAVAEGIPTSAIARFLIKRGFSGKEGPAARHLRGRCGCSTR